MSLTNGDSVDGQVNFATMIVRNDHPRLEQIVQQYMMTVKMLSQKPE